jgi:hypothetical protein
MNTKSAWAVPSKTKKLKAKATQPRTLGRGCKSYRFNCLTLGNLIGIGPQILPGNQDSFVISSIIWVNHENPKALFPEPGRMNLLESAFACLALTFSKWRTASTANFTHTKKVKSDYKSLQLEDQ